MIKTIPPHAISAVLTGNDLLVFEVLRAANGPTSAYDILDRLKPDRPRIAPTTVYRALEHLIRAGRVRRIECLNAYLAATDAGDRAVVFAICDDCGRVQERDDGEGGVIASLRSNPVGGAGRGWIAASLCSSQ